ncbi:hypothetical protein ABZ419_11285 [Streptomyces cinnamoneus]|uniref:hypothetical protein n=1 Tax=Streptomyces cinnamoneus TaxID=53446 RepID=UPI003405DFFC
MTSNPSRGTCPVCGREFQVTRFEGIRVHSNPDAPKDWYRAPICKGAGQLPSSEETGR